MSVIENDILNLNNLFDLYDRNKLDLGLDKVYNNLFIHEEIKGITKLLRYKFLGEDLLLGKQLLKKYKVADLKEIQEIKLNSLNLIKNREALEFYKLLKSCGFTNNNIKYIIHDIKEKKIGKISLGEYLLEINSLNLVFEGMNDDERIIFQRKISLLANYYSSKKDNNASISRYDILINELSKLGYIEMILNQKVRNIQNLLDDKKDLIENSDDKKVRLEMGISFFSEKNLVNLSLEEAIEIRKHLNELKRLDKIRKELNKELRLIRLQIEEYNEDVKIYHKKKK